jgi:DNA-binding IclR family transcriptional regulator
VSSIDRAVRILRFLAEKGDAAPLKEIQEATEMPASSAHRILSQLLSYNFVVQDKGDRRYGLGFGLVRLAQSAVNHSAGFVDITPRLAEFRDRWNEFSCFCSLVENNVVCLQVLPAVKEPYRTQFFVRPGKILPFNSSASAKVILAYQDLDKIEAIVCQIQFRAFTDKTITDPGVLMQHLELVKEQGYALCEEELEIGVSAIATPIHNIFGDVNSCLTLVAPTARLQIHLSHGLLDTLKNVSERMRPYLLETS